MRRERHPRWTRPAVLDAIRQRATELGIGPGDLAPMSSQLGASLCNAAHKLFGGKDKACAILGFEPNGKGASRACKIRKRTIVRPRPEPEARVRDPVVARELAMHLERMRKRYTEDPASIPRRIRIPTSRRRIRVRGYDRWDGFLPPENLAA